MQRWLQCWLFLSVRQKQPSPLCQRRYRDYIHTTDLGRLIAAYTWYCTLTGRQVTELQLDVIPGFLRHNAADQKTDLALTETQKAIVLESVQNALANPYQVTQSQYQ